MYQCQRLRTPHCLLCSIPYLPLYLLFPTHTSPNPLTNNLTLFHRSSYSQLYLTCSWLALPVVATLSQHYITLLIMVFPLPVLLVPHLSCMLPMHLSYMVTTCLLCPHPPPMCLTHALFYLPSMHLSCLLLLLPIMHHCLHPLSTSLSLTLHSLPHLLTVWVWIDLRSYLRWLLISTSGLGSIKEVMPRTLLPLWPRMPPLPKPRILPPPKAITPLRCIMGKVD